jgi:hypothetical protein
LFTFRVSVHFFLNGGTAVPPVTMFICSSSSAKCGDVEYLTVQTISRSACRVFHKSRAQLFYYLCGSQYIRVLIVF